MRRLKVGSLSLVFFFLGFSSCQGIFDSSLLGSVDWPADLVPAEMSDATLAEVEALTASDRFFEQLQTDDAARAALSANLEAVMASGTPAEKAQAAELYLEIQLWGTGAGDAVNNIFQALLPAMGGDTSALDMSGASGNPAELQTVLQGLFGTDPAVIASTLEGLQNMVAAYELLETAGQLGDLGGDLYQASALAAVVDVMITAGSVQDVVDLVSGATTDLSAFNTSTIDVGFVDIMDGMSGTSGDYTFLNTTLDFIN